MDPSVLTLLERLYRFGQDNDAQITERPKRMLNITADTGRLLWILVRLTHAKRILEVGTSNGFSTIWLADAAQGLIAYGVWRLSCYIRTRGGLCRHGDCSSARNRN